MSRLVLNALQRHYLHHGAGYRPFSPRTRMGISCGLLQYILQRYGFKLDSWSVVCLEATVNTMHSKGLQWQPIGLAGVAQSVGHQGDELLGIIGKLVLNLSDGRRHAQQEAALIAWIYDHSAGTLDMATLREQMSNAFLWIAIDGGLRRMGNQSGFNLTCA